MSESFSILIMNPHSTAEVGVNNNQAKMGIRLSKVIRIGNGINIDIAEDLEYLDQDEKKPAVIRWH